MIKCDLEANATGFEATVEMSTFTSSTPLSMAQREVELTAIYDALADKYTTDGAIDIIINSVARFMERHK